MDTRLSAFACIVFSCSPASDNFILLSATCSVVSDSTRRHCCSAASSTGRPGVRRRLCTSTAPRSA